MSDATYKPLVDPEFFSVPSDDWEHHPDMSWTRHTQDGMGAIFMAYGLPYGGGNSAEDPAVARPIPQGWRNLAHK
jgi:hypothetical protein